MAERSWPWDSVEEDRPLNTEQWARGHASLVLNGFVPDVGDEMAVTETSPESLAVDVNPGRYWIEGRLYEVHSEPVEVPLATADPTNPRIDRVVVRRSMSNREITVEALTGTPAADPAPPSLTQNAAGDWEEPLARVLVEASATDVSDDDITDERSPAIPALGGQVLLDQVSLSGTVGTGTDMRIPTPLRGMFHRYTLQVKAAEVGTSVPVPLVVWINGISDAEYRSNASVWDTDSDDVLLRYTEASTTHPRTGYIGVFTPSLMFVEFHPNGLGDVNSVVWVGNGWANIGGSGAGGLVSSGGRWLGTTQELTHFTVRTNSTEHEWTSGSSALLWGHL